jgi:hypothetical protein
LNSIPSTRGFNFLYGNQPVWKALALIQELNETSGKQIAELYKSQILSVGKFQNAEITNLEQLIEKNPQEESNYISLIFLYSKNDEEKSI